MGVEQCRQNGERELERDLERELWRANKNADPLIKK